MKFLLFLLSTILCTGVSYGQILISDKPNETPHPSAQLEVRSSQRGFLPPVMTTQERRSIENPAQGLIVFDSTRQLMFVYTKIGWQSFSMTPDVLSISNGLAFPNAGFNVNDQAGSQVEIYGDYAYLGAFTSTISGKVEQGSVYLYKYDNGIWRFKEKIIAADGQAGDYFGNDICANGDYVFFGASGDTYGENAKQGSVYVYKWIDTSLVFQNKFTGSNATAGDGFGSVVEAKDNLLVVAATNDDIGANTDQGSVYFFELENNNWVEKQKYFATANVGINDLLGGGIRIDENFVVVGCSFMNTQGNFGFNRNRVSVFTKMASGEWIIHSEILNPTGQNYEAFGYDITLKDDILTISAPMMDIPFGNKDRGAVYVYKRNAQTWNLIQTLAPTDSSTGDAIGDFFGLSTDRDGNYLVIGASMEDYGPGQINYGGAYVYEWNGTQFVQIKKLRSTSPQVNERFGTNVGIQNGRIVVGAAGRNSNSGAGYFFIMD